MRDEAMHPTRRLLARGMMRTSSLRSLRPQMTSLTRFEESRSEESMTARMQREQRRERGTTEEEDSARFFLIR
jgi:hypothetical protein